MDLLQQMRVTVNGRPYEERTDKSCLLFAVQVSGREVFTIEGLAEDCKLHPIQEAFVEKYGFRGEAKDNGGTYALH